MFGPSKRNLSDLDDREMLALAIASEEEDSRIYAAYADGLREQYPASARMFEEMSAVEQSHCRLLTERFQAKFGDIIPPIRREDVSGFMRRRPYWLTRPLDIKIVREQAELMELQAYNFYIKAAQQTNDLTVRTLLNELAATERGHQSTAANLGDEHVPVDAAAEEAETQRRAFVLQVVQPGLAGLMDGSVSTLAPLFAAAFATHNSWDAFLVGVAASIGAGISMGFAEALSDDGSLTGRGSPWIRGVVSGLMTMLGGLGHTLPYLIKDFYAATTIAVIVVLIELAAISWIRAKYMDTPILKAAFQVVIGGLLVFVTGVAIGGAG